MIRVCHVITLLELGGAQQNTLYTCSKMDPSRFDVHLLTGRGGYLDGEAVRLLGGRARFLPELVREIRPGRDVGAYFSLRQAFRELRPAIVHTHSSKAGILGRAAARAERVPVIVHSIHGFPFNERQPWLVRHAYIGAERLAARWTRRFVAVSRRNAEEGIRRGLFSEDRVSVIRSGIDLAAFAAGEASPGKRAEWGIPEGAPLVGTVACLKPQKAPFDFVAVCVRVSEEVPDAHFLLVGDGAMRPRLERKVEEMGMGGRVHLAGWREDVPEIMRLLDVFVLTSRWEGLPRAVLQARATGVPVVATAVDGTVEAVEDGVCGYLYPPGEVAAMAARVIELLRNRDKRLLMGERGRSGLEEFDQDEMVKQQEELYLDLTRGT